MGAVSSVGAGGLGALGAAGPGSGTPPSLQPHEGAAAPQPQSVAAVQQLPPPNNPQRGLQPLRAQHLCLMRKQSIKQGLLQAEAQPQDGPAAQLASQLGAAQLGAAQLGAAQLGAAAAQPVSQHGLQQSKQIWGRLAQQHCSQPRNSPMQQ